MQVPILKQGPYVIASIQAALTDDDLLQLRDALVEQVLDVAGSGHRALVFSQFTRFLRIARRRLEAAGVDQWNIYLMTHSQEETLEAYGREIIPAMHGVAAART